MRSLATSQRNGFETLPTPNIWDDSEEPPGSKFPPKRLDSRELRVTQKWLKMEPKTSSKFIDKYYQNHKSMMNIQVGPLNIEEQGEEKSNRSKWLIRSTSKFRLRWDLFIMVLAVYNCIATPVNVAFNPDFMQSVSFIVINSLIDLLFFMDIVINFRTSFLHLKTGDEITNPKTIAIEYIKGRFWIDLIASIPFDTFALFIFSANSTELQLFGLLKLVRVLRLGRIITYMNAKDDVKLSLKLIKLIFFLVLYLHWFGCLWYLIVDQDKDWIPPLDYLYVKTDIYQRNTGYKYLMSLYHSVLVLTGNEVGPRDSLQLLVISLFITIGAIINANLFGEFAVLISALNRKATKFQEKIDIANTAMKNMKLPERIQAKVIGFLRYTNTLLESQKELEIFLDMIPPSLREVVIRIIFEKLLLDKTSFRNSPQCIEYLTRKMRTKIYMPEEYVVSQGEQGKEMYFIAKGECSVFVKDKRKTQQFVRTLSEGDIFGEIALINNTARTASVRTFNYWTISNVTKQTFNEMSMEFPETYNTLRNEMKKYQDPWKIYLKKLLRGVPYFSNLDDEIIEELSYELQMKYYDDSHQVFKQGDSVEDIHIIVEGTLDLLLEISDEEIEFETLYRGCTVGIYGVVGRYGYWFTGKAGKSLITYTLSQHSIDKVGRRFYKLEMEITKMRRNVAKSGLPIVDFSLYRVDSVVLKVIDILRIAVCRIAKINSHLSTKKFPGEIVDLLDILKYNSQYKSHSNKQNLIRMQTGSIDVMNLLLQRIDSLEEKFKYSNLKLKKTLRM